MYVQVVLSVTGSSFLTVMDRLLFEVIPETRKMSVENIGKKQTHRP